MGRADSSTTLGFKRDDRNSEPPFSQPILPPLTLFSADQQLSSFFHTKLYFERLWTDLLREITSGLGRDEVIEEKMELSPVRPNLTPCQSNGILKIEETLKIPYFHDPNKGSRQSVCM